MKSNFVGRSFLSDLCVSLHSPYHRRVVVVREILPMYNLPVQVRVQPHVCVCTDAPGSRPYPLYSTLYASNQDD